MYMYFSILYLATDQILLVPSKLAKFHQNFHTFRGYEFYEILSEVNLLPCHDYIFWQLFLEKLVKNELKRSLPITRCSDTPYQSLTHVKQNAVRYGFVV